MNDNKKKTNNNPSIHVTVFKWLSSGNNSYPSLVLRMLSRFELMSSKGMSSRSFIKFPGRVKWIGPKPHVCALNLYLF